MSQEAPKPSTSNTPILDLVSIDNQLWRYYDVAHQHIIAVPSGFAAIESSFSGILKIVKLIKL